MSNAEDEAEIYLKRGKVFMPWGLLRSVGNSRAAKLTVLIPLVGYLILLNDDIVAHLSLSKDVFGDAVGATLTRLPFKRVSSLFGLPRLLEHWGSRMSRAEPGGISLTEAEATTAKGMLLRGGRQYDSAAWFGVNGGRLGETVATRKAVLVTRSLGSRVAPFHRED